MDGIFVDSRGRLVVIPRVSPEARALWVYGVDDLDDDKYDPDGWTARLEKDPHEGHKVTLIRPGAEMCEQGECDSDRRVTWASGETWIRLQMSHEQVYLLTRRPYVPITLVLLSGTWTVLCSLYRSSVRFFGQRV